MRMTYEFYNKLENVFLEKKLLSVIHYDYNSDCESR